MTRTPSLSSQQAVTATVLYFAFNGLIIGTWAGSLPALRERLDLDARHISILLVVTGLAAIANMQLSGRLVDRFGVRYLSLAHIPLLMAGIGAVALAPTFGWLLAAGVVIGAGNGGIDVAMNALGVQVEKARPRPIMSFFHGMWSVGNFAGALLVLIVATLAGQPARFWVVGAAATIAISLGIPTLIAAWRFTPQTPRVHHVDSDGARTPIPKSAYLLGLMAIFFGLGEGTAMDWSGILTADVTGISSGQASIAVVAVALFMVAIRLMGDWLVERFGRRAIVQFGGLCASAGYLVTALGGTLPMLLAGWALVGFGIGMIAPQVYAVAGHSGGGRGLAVVVTFGYATFLAGPAIIGFLVSIMGIQNTMLVPAILLLSLVFLARIMPPKDAALT